MNPSNANTIHHNSGRASNVACYNGSAHAFRTSHWATVTCTECLKTRPTMRGKIMNLIDSNNDQHGEHVTLEGNDVTTEYAPIESVSLQEATMLIGLPSNGVQS